MRAPALAAAPAMNSPDTEQPAPTDPNTADMREMHEQMLRDYPEMGRMHQQMVEQYPEMGRMHEQMMGH